MAIQILFIVCLHKIAIFFIHLFYVSTQIKFKGRQMQVSLNKTYFKGQEKPQKQNNLSISNSLVIAHQIMHLKQ